MRLSPIWRATPYAAKGRSLQMWRGGSASNGQFIWRSKLFMVPEGTSFLTAAGLAQDVGLVGIKLFADGEQVMELSPGNLVPGRSGCPGAWPVLADRGLRYLGGEPHHSRVAWREMVI